MSIFRCVVAATALSLFATHTDANAFELIFGGPNNQAAHIIYNPSDGNVSFYSPNDPLQSMQIESRSGLFSNWTWTKVPPWDVQTAFKQTHFDFEGYAVDPFDLGPILPAGMSAGEVIAEVTVDGSRLAGGKIDSSPGGGPYLCCVPEPSAATLASLGGVACLVFRRRR